MMKKISYFSLVIFGIVFLLNALNAIPVADDFCSHFSSQDSGILKYAINFYLSWSGRFLTVLTAGFLNKIFPLENQNLISVFLAFSFLVFIVQFSKLIAVDRTNRTKQFIIATSLFTITWFTYRQMIGRVVIWYSGGIVYIFWYVLIPFFFFEFIKCFKDKRFSIYLLTLILLLSNSLETIPPAMVFFVMTYAALNKKTFNFSDYKYIFTILVIITVASVPLYLAPGNFVRANTINPNMKYTLVSLLNSYIDVARVFFSAGINTFLMTIPIAVICSFFLGDNQKKDQRMIAFCLIGSAIGSGLPMGFAHGHNGARPASLFVLLVTFGIFGVISSIKFKISWKRYGEIYSIVLLLLVSIFVSFDVYRGHSFREYFIKRDRYLKSLSNQNIEAVVSPFVGKVPRSLNGHELKADKNHWINVCVAKHYALKSVRIMYKP